MPQRLSAGFAWTCLALAWLSWPGHAGARDDLSGTWREEFEEVVVSLEQWSAACGEAPRTTGRRVRALVFQVEDRGVELVFRGPAGQRFSSVGCQTDNPAVKPKERTLQDALFLVACSTPEDAPSYENGLYSFRVVHGDRLEYRETTRYARNVPGGQCASTRRVRRVYVRLAAAPRPAAQDAGTALADAPPRQEAPSKGEAGGQGLDAGAVADARQGPDAGAMPGAGAEAGEAILGHKLPRPRLPYRAPPDRVDAGHPPDPAGSVEDPEPLAVVDAGPPAEPAQPEAARPVPVEPEPAAPPPPHPGRNSSPEVPADDGWTLWAGLGGGLVLALLVGVLLLSRKPRWRPPPDAQVSQAPAPLAPSASEPAPSAPPAPAPEPPVFCTGCGARLPETARFCPHCATRVR